jgi:putative peptidoglycan lipid II flippase
MEPAGEPRSAPAAASGKARGPSFRSALAVGLLTLLSRITGLFRVTTQAHFLGTGPVADAFGVAFQIPNLLRRLVGEGAVSAAVVPVFARAASGQDRAQEKVFLEKFLSLWLVLVLAVTVAGVLFSGWIVGLLFRWGSFRDAEKFALTVDLTRFLFWYLLFIGAAAAFQGILNARNVFALPSTSPLVFNLAFVAGAWIAAPGLPPGDRAFVLAGAVLVGGALQLAIMVPAVWRLGARPRPRWPLDHPGVRKMLRLLLPATFGAGVYQINTLINTAIAARLEDGGAVAALNYSNRFMELVLGIFVISLGTVSLSTLSRQAAEKDLAAYRATALDLLRLVGFVTIPSTVGLFLLRRPMLSLFLESGEFGAQSLEETASAFQFHLLGLCCVGMSRVLVNCFYALGEVAIPVRIGALNLLVDLPLAWILSATQLTFSGIALAASLAAAVQMLALLFALRRRAPQLNLLEALPSLFKTSLAAAIMGALVWSAAGFLRPEVGKPLLACLLFLTVAGGAAVFFAASSLLGMPEARMLRRLRSG